LENPLFPVCWRKGKGRGEKKKKKGGKKHDWCRVHLPLLVARGGGGQLMLSIASFMHGERRGKKKKGVPGVMGFQGATKMMASRHPIQ